MDPVRHARPSLIETIVEDDDPSLGQRALTGGKIVRGNLSRMPAIDADKAEWAATKLQQMPGGKLCGVSLVKDKAACVRVAAEISLEAVQVARAGVINVQLLTREQVDGNGRFIL